MWSQEELRDRAQGAGRLAVWKPPDRSDQAPGEETVQVNDVYIGGQEAPLDEAHRDDDQHPTGG